jgi:hypothetical protein
VYPLLWILPYQTFILHVARFEMFVRIRNVVLLKFTTRCQQSYFIYLLPLATRISFQHDLMSFVHGFAHFLLQKYPTGHSFCIIRCWTASQDLYVVMPIQRNSLSLQALLSSGASVTVYSGSSVSIFVPWSASSSDNFSWAENICTNVASKTYKINKCGIKVSLVFN